MMIPGFAGRPGVFVWLGWEWFHRKEREGCKGFLGFVVGYGAVQRPFSTSGCAAPAPTQPILSFRTQWHRARRVEILRKPGRGVRRVSSAWRDGT